MTRDAKPTVFYDGACPMCRREIGMYKRRDGDGVIEWIDVSSCELARLPSDLRRSDAEARFHVLCGDGKIVSGAAAFAELWWHTKGFRWLGRIARVPPVTKTLDVVYRGFLVVRPALQVWMRRLEARGRNANTP